MTRDHELDRILDQWFTLGAEGAPEGAVDRALAIAWTTPQSVPFGRRGSSGSWAWLPRIGVRVGIALLLVALAATAVMIGTRPRPTTITFSSERYGYRLTLGTDWTIERATEDWSLAQPWDAPPAADRFVRDGQRFAVVSRRAVDDATADHWSETFVSDRPELVDSGTDPRCVDPAGVAPPIRTAGDLGWQDAIIGQQSGVVRIGCGFVDAVVIVRDRAYVLSMFSGRQPLADLAAFEEIAGTVEFVPELVEASPSPPVPSLTPAVPTPSPTATPVATFESELYDYRLEVPATWTVEPATERWTGGQPRFAGPYADRFKIPRTLSIVAVELPDGATVESWIGSVPRPSAYEISGGGHRHCVFRGPGTTTMEGAGAHTAWQPTTLVGRPAYLRALCGQVDAVIADGDRVVVLGLDTGRSLSGEVGKLHAVVAGLDLGPVPAAETEPLDPHGTISITSTHHGYRAPVPWRWERRMATRPLAELRVVQGTGSDVRFDRLADDGTHLIWVASTPVGAGVTAADVARSLPRRQAGAADDLAGLSCTLAGETVTGLAPEAWIPTSIGDVPAMERDSCFFIDVVAVVGGRAYLISGRSPVATSTFAGGRLYLDEFLGSFEFLPAEADDTE